MKDYTYDTYGNPLTTKTSSNGSGFMQTTTAYSENGNHAVRQTDARGKTVVRNTDAAMDTLLSVTDPRGQTVNYAYDQNRKVTKTTAVVDGKEYVNQYTYTKDKLTQVKHNTSANAAEDVTYHFEFDAASRPTNVKVGSQLLSKTTYNTDGTVKQVDYGNEDSIQYTYDAFKRLTGVRGRWDAEDRYVYEYGANGQVARLTNDELSIVSTSEYDAANRPMRITHKNSVSDVHLYTGEVTYDQYNNLAAFKEQVGADRAAYTTTFTHDNENRPTQLDFGSSRQVAYTYDGLGRVSKRTVNAGGTAVETNYGYLAGGHGTGSTTPLVQTISQNGMTLTYTYDDAGNITSVSDGSKTVSYVYDLLGQLIRANDPYDTTAGDSGTTWVYSYDQGGNILSRAAYAFTTDAVGTAVQTNRYVYDDANWKDKLTTYNGKTIPYDAIGNPLSDGNWNLTWVDGRRLRSMYKGEAGQPGYDEITFEYNENGLRTKKTRMYYDNATGDIGYKATSYTLHGKNIVHLSDGSNNLHFFYDAQNKPAVVVFNGTAYAYLYNLQGDVIGLIDSNGTQVVKYAYDAWGKPISKTGSLASTLGTIQPFRYRGYVFDEETGLYYLQTRFYDPSVCRFVNADDHAVRNLYSYTDNSPICNEDRTGTESIAIPYPSGSDVGFVTTILNGLLAGVKGLSPWIVSPWAIAAAIIFTPSTTANDEKVWDQVRAIPAYGTLTAALQLAKTKGLSSNRQPNKPTNIHHIVPQTMASAQPARSILEAVGIDPATSPENLVEVSTQMHWFMHTSVYTTSINTIIGFAYNLSSKQEEQRTNVSLTLTLLGNLIRTIDQGVQ